jgi:hypothetical protein
MAGHISCHFDKYLLYFCNYAYVMFLSMTFMCIWLFNSSCKNLRHERQDNSFTQQSFRQDHKNGIYANTPSHSRIFLTCPYVHGLLRFRHLYEHCKSIYEYLQVIYGILRVLAMHLRQTSTICSEWTRTIPSNLRHLTIYLGIFTSVLRNVTI